MTQFAVAFVTVYMAGRLIYEVKSFKTEMKDVDSSLVVYFNKNQARDDNEMVLPQSKSLTEKQGHFAENS